jgi:hypothetical protein
MACTKENLATHIVILEARPGGDNKVKCVYCDKEFTPETSRVAAHLGSGNVGAGISICSKVPKVVSDHGFVNLNKTGLYPLRRNASFTRFC